MATHTNLGTPCARSWSPDWFAAVDAKETERNHRICGARLPDATPCTNTTDHASGRCRFHGGFDLTGAPPGNRNHVIHGLYSRRLRTCTETCPYWQTCPVAAERRNSPTNPASESPSSDFPTSPTEPAAPTSPIHVSRTKDSAPRIGPSSALLCPYQLTEYNSVLTDALAVVESQPHPNPMGLHAAHNVAMLQVMVSTAGAYMAQTSPWSSGGNSTESATADTPNFNATMAFFRLMREFRASLKMLCMPAHTPLNRQKNTATPPTPEGILRHAQRIQFDTGLDPDSIADAQLEPQSPQTHARAYVQQAALAGGQGRDIEMCEAFDNAAALDEPYAQSERDHVLKSYRPAKQTVSEELAAKILGNRHHAPRPENATAASAPDHRSPSTKSTESTTSTESTATTESTESTASTTSTESLASPESLSSFSSTTPPDNDDNDILQRYLDLFRDGKIPPEAFPINSPIRAHAETIYTGVSHDVAP